MSLTIYYHPVSPPSNLALGVLNHFGVEYEKKAIKLEEGENKKEEYLKINPLGQVPAIADGDFVLNESLAICRYILQTRTEPGDFYPTHDAKKVARINSLLDTMVGTFKEGITSFVFKGYVGPAFRGLPVPTAEEYEKLLQGYKNSLNIIKQLLETSGGHYLTGDNLTLADFGYYFWSLGGIYLADGGLADFPEVADWVQRIEETSTISEQIKTYKETAAHFNEVIKKTIAEKSK